LPVNNRNSLLLPFTAVFLTVCLFGACGNDRSGGPKGAPAAIVSAAPDRTEAAHSARVTIDAQQATATGVVQLDALAARLVVRPGPTVVVSGGTTFVTLSSAADKWRRAESFDAELPRLQSSDPFVAIDLLRGMQSVETWGGAEVRGASTIRYTVKTDPSVAASLAPPGRAAALRMVAADAGAGQIQLDVFIDSAGRVRRVQLPAPLKAGKPIIRPDGELQAVTIDYEDFGVAVDVAPPPPDQVEGS